jgi:hypothetical protein
MMTRELQGDAITFRGVGGGLDFVFSSCRTSLVSRNYSEYVGAVD